MWRWTYRTGPNLPKRSKSSSGVTLKLQPDQRVDAWLDAMAATGLPQVLYEESSACTGRISRAHGWEARGAGGRRLGDAAYRLTSGASLPPLLILWRRRGERVMQQWRLEGVRGRAGGRGVWRDGGVIGSQLGAEVARAREAVTWGLGTMPALVIVPYV